MKAAPEGAAFLMFFCDTTFSIFSSFRQESRGNTEGANFSEKYPDFFAKRIKKRFTKKINTNIIY